MSKNNKKQSERDALRNQYISLGGLLEDTERVSINLKDITLDITELTILIKEIEMEDNKLTEEENRVQELKELISTPCPSDNACNSISFGDIDSDYKNNPICLGCACLQLCCSVTSAKNELSIIEGSKIDNSLLNGGKKNKRIKKEKVEKSPKEDRSSTIITLAVLRNPTITIKQLVIDHPQFDSGTITRYYRRTNKVLTLQKTLI